MNQLRMINRMWRIGIIQRLTSIVEGHIAFLHAELGITPEQEQLWSDVAAAMRQDVKDMECAEERVARHQSDHETAIHYLKNREMFANLRAQGERPFFWPLCNRSMTIYPRNRSRQQMICWLQPA